MAMRKMIGSRTLALVLAFAGPAVLSACSSSSEQQETRLSDDSDGDDWAAFGRTYGEQHYSPLTQIDQSNVGDLALAWYVDLPQNENSVTGPLEIGGQLYFASGYSHVRSLDVKTGELLWDYSPGAAEASGKKLRQGWGSRGLAWWNGKVYTGTQDGRLIALDADTGRELWSVQTTEPGDYRFISGAPRVFDGKIIIGHGGADAADTRGYVTAYDAETGEQLWRFYTVPGNPADGFENDAMRKAAETWAGEWWKYGGGGTVWNAITYDEDLDQIYIGTGNGAPWNYQIRSEGKGDNLYLSSIIALDAETGDYVWHYQTNPAESWDYNASMDMELAELPIDGKPRKILMTAPKNGFLYTLDRQNGKLISAKPYVPVTWAKGIDMKTGRPIEAEGLRGGDGPFEMAPGTFGAHSWLPMAFSPKTSLVYIPALELSMLLEQVGSDDRNWKRTPDNILDGGVAASLPEGKEGSSALVAIDPVTQEQKWRIPTPGFINGGVFATASNLVFQGQVDGKFNAYDAVSGERLWSFDAGTAVIAPPITYMHDGVQYVTVMTGLGTSSAYLGPLLARFDLDPRTQKRRVLTFRLGGEAKLPVTPETAQPIPADPDFVPDAAAIGRGAMLFGSRCAVCHGMDAVGAGVAPDLRKSLAVRSPDVFRQILGEGMLVSTGMPRFAELSREQRADIRQYIRGQGVKGRNKP